MEYVLKCTDVGYLYKGTDKGIFDIDLNIEKGSIVGLLGESGSGKSTLAKCVSKQFAGYSGEIEVKNIGYIFQDNYASLNPKKTVGWLLKEVIRFNDKENLLKADEIIDKILTETELDPSVKSHKPNELSGGQRQRVSIAMALLSGPDLLIADEPVSALDVTVQKQVVRLLKKLNEKRGLAILFISHDIKVVEELCDYLYILKDGRIVEEGKAEKLFREPENEYTKDLLQSSFLLD